MLYKSIDKLGQDLAETLQSAALSQEDRSQNLNALKMLLYSQIALMKKIDKDVFTYSEGKGKTKKFAPEDMDHTQWEEKRYKSLLQLFNIIQLPLENLWQPPVPEENFVNLIADIAYRSLEHPTIKDKNVGDTSIQILGTLLKRYNHSLVFPVRTFEILKSCEMAIPAISQGMVVLYEQYGMQTIFKVMIEQVRVFKCKLKLKKYD